MIIKSIYETSYPKMYKVQPDSGSTFFIRQDYLVKVDFEKLEAGTVLLHPIITVPKINVRKSTALIFIKSPRIYLRPYPRSSIRCEP